MKMPTIQDSRGKESTTLFLVAIAFFPIVFKFIFGGAVIKFGAEAVWNIPVMGGVDYAAAIGAVLAIWTARENKEKNLPKQTETV